MRSWSSGEVAVAEGDRNNFEVGVGGIARGAAKERLGPVELRASLNDGRGRAIVRRFRYRPKPS